MWTNPQRAVLACLVLLAGGWLGVRAFTEPAYVPAPQPARGILADRLQDRLDPNAATWQEWAALPNIGEKRAKQIVDYRERRAKVRDGKPPFERLDDLLWVKGLGVNLVGGLKPYLSFPTPATVGEPVLAGHRIAPAQ